MWAPSVLFLQSWTNALSFSDQEPSTCALNTLEWECSKWSPGQASCTLLVTLDILLCNRPQSRVPLGVSWRPGANHQSHRYQQTMLTSRYKGPETTLDPQRQSNRLVTAFTVLTRVQCSAGASFTSATHLRPIPGPQELIPNPSK